MPRHTVGSGTPTAPSQEAVRVMFDDLVPRYDLLNDLLSLGLDRWWRRRAVAALEVRPGARVLDLGCGTGRLGARLRGRARVVGVDVSLAMLQEARASGRLRPVQGSAFLLPFADGAFDAALSAFVLRNLNDLPTAFADLARVVVPGGSIALVDITRPAGRVLGGAFDAYFGTVAPALGGLVGRREAYRYLVRSLAHLPAPDDMCRMLESAGFVSSRARPLTAGTVTLFTAIRAGDAGGPWAGRPAEAGRRGAG